MTKDQDRPANQLVDPDENTFQTVFENAFFGIVLVGTDGYFIKANKAACNLFGYTQDELLSLTFKDLTHPEDLDAGVNLYHELMGGKRSFAKMEKRYLTKDGNIIWTLLSTSVIQKPSGDPHYLVTLFQDITDRKQAEFELAKNEKILEELVISRTQKLSALVDVITVASSSLDLEEVLEHSLDSVLDVMNCNMGAIHLLDETRKKIRLTSWRNVPEKILEEIDTLPISKSLPGRILNQDGPLIIPEMLKDPDTVPAARQILGKRVYLGIPLKAKGKTVGVLVIIGQAERIFTQEEIALLESIAQQIGVAVENARLHEQAEILATTEERQRIAREIHDILAQGFIGINIQLDAVDSALELGNQKLARERLSRARKLADQNLIEARRSVWALRSKTLEDKNFCDALRDSIRGLATGSGLEISIDIQDDLPVVPVELQTDLLRVTQEAVMNVIKHAGATRLDVKFKCNQENIILQITDDGRGFVIFDEATMQNDWSGFGITAMRERIDRHGGQIAIDSTPNRGTSITINIDLGD